MVRTTVYLPQRTSRPRIPLFTSDDGTIGEHAAAYLSGFGER
jgi:hypothetical protein